MWMFWCHEIFPHQIMVLCNVTAVLLIFTTASTNAITRIPFGNLNENKILAHTKNTVLNHHRINYLQISY